MYEHHIDEMTKAIMKRAINTFVLNSNPEIDQHIREALFSYWHDKIAIVWTVEDVQEYARENHADGIKLTDDQAREILNDVFDNTSAEYGISWETIDSYICDYIREVS
uniref:Uncharacterized protein n=1 Tax=viral metagenome TaxID=1070528 RepID=A0A6M3L954_9ZZZZ